ncbi:MAG TPA: hypothetical protein VLW17_11680, partial [Thermoanaerobaculaceae bacterium]|nr:hypothetical protein [Thermoanaerobaculaceae bacterium]
MLRAAAGATLVLVLVRGALAQAPPAHRRGAPPPDPVVTKLREAAASDPLAWERLAYLCDRIGPRIAGSAPFLAAVKWAKATFEQDRLDAVRLEPVTTELWVRGRERAAMTAPVAHDLPMLGL